METSYNFFLLCLSPLLPHISVARETDHELFIVSDLVIAFIHAVSYCAQDIYRLIEVIVTA